MAKGNMTVSKSPLQKNSIDERIERLENIKWPTQSEYNELQDLKNEKKYGKEVAILNRQIINDRIKNSESNAYFNISDVVLENATELTIYSTQKGYGEFSHTSETIKIPVSNGEYDSKKIPRNLRDGVAQLYKQVKKYAKKINIKIDYD